MRGHDAIISMRKAGKKPGVVFINDFNCKTDWDLWDDHPTIDVSGDKIYGLDLRFLVGVAVSISSCDEKRAKALFNACKRASCSVVAACHVQEGVFPAKQSGWTEVYRA